MSIWVLVDKMSNKSKDVPFTNEENKDKISNQKSFDIFKKSSIKTLSCRFSVDSQLDKSTKCFNTIKEYLKLFVLLITYLCSNYILYKQDYIWGWE